MFRRLRSSILLITLGALAMLPAPPMTQAASTKLHPAETENAATLPGEISAELRTPPEETRPSGGSDAHGAMARPEGCRGDHRPEPDGAGSGGDPLPLEATVVPWQAGSNTSVVGCALGFMSTRVPYVFYELDNMEPGDEIIVEGPAGKEYLFRV